MKTSVNQSVSANQVKNQLKNQFLPVHLNGANIHEFEFQPFSMVLIRLNKNGEIVECINFGNLKNNKTITAYMELLNIAVIHSEYYANLTSNLDFLAFQYYKGDILRSDKGFNIGANKITSMLNSGVIYTTGKDGKINSAIVAKEVQFKETFLNIAKCKGLVNKYIECVAGKITTKEYTNCVHEIATKVELQCNYFKEINARIEFFYHLCETEKENTKATKKVEATKVDETKKVEATNVDETKVAQRQKVLKEMAANSAKRAEDIKKFKEEERQVVNG